MVGRNDDAPPSPRDVKIIALEAELQEYKTRDAKTNQIINDLTKKSRDLENEVCFFLSFNNNNNNDNKYCTCNFIQLHAHKYRQHCKNAKT